MNDSINQTIKVGTIFVMSWGYDQTNVNFFQVTRLSKSGVFVREIASKSVPGTNGFMSTKVVPVKDMFLDRSQWCNPKGQSFSGNVETFRRIDYETSPSFSFKGRYWAFLWDNNPQFCSWYA